MGRKQAPKIEPKDLYEETIIFVIAHVDNDAFGKFVGPSGRVQSVAQAIQFLDYDSAKAFIVDRMLENVSIMKVWI